MECAMKSYIGNAYDSIKNIIHLYRMPPIYFDIINLKKTISEPLAIQ